MDKLELSYKGKTGKLDKIGLGAEKIGDFQAAKKAFKQALLLSENENTIKDIIYFSNNLGGIHLKLDNHTKAIKFFQRSYDLSSEMNDKKRMSVCLNNIGNVYFCLENYEKSLEYFLKSFKYREKTEEELHIANSLNNIGAIYLQINNNKKALGCFEKAFKIHSKIDNLSGIKVSLNNLGITFDKMKDYKKAMEYHKKSLAIRKESGNKTEISYALNNIGNIYKNKGEFTKALEFYLQAFEPDEKQIDKSMYLIILINLGSTYFEIKDYKNAIAYLQRSLRIASEMDLKENLLTIYSYLSDYYKEVGKFDDALEFYKKHSEIKDKLNEKNTSKKILELQMNFEIKQKAKEKELDKLKSIGDKYSLISKDLEQRIERDFIGESKAIKDIIKDTLKAAEYDKTNVLITGESGTGKEIIARIIHHASSRKEDGFYPINCSSVPDSLLESEFFGHKKGTFTGAVNDKKGLFQLAHKGTLFLDEIADMQLALQAKLLRAIEEKKIKRVGGAKEIHVDIRIIAATNQNIIKLLDEKKFRLDLYHRLNTLIINIPPLRERPEDIESLLNHFVQSLSKKINKSLPIIDPDLLDFLKQYNFPGNVREFKNLVERALIICENNILNQKCFPLIHSHQQTKTTSVLNIKENEIILIKSALKKTNFNKSKAAEILGISRHTLLRRIAELDIRK